MRAVVMILALLAGLKIWAHDQMFRSGAEEALIAAYRERAIAACQRDAARTLKGQSAGSAQAWSSPAAVKVSIGRSGVDVNIWDVDNALWASRYKSAYLTLVPADRSATCEYDVTAGQAEIVKL